MSDTTWRVQLVEGSSAPVLAAIHAVSFSPSDVWDEATFASLTEAPGAITGIALCDGGDDPEPAGFITARIVLDEADILTFAVSPMYRRHGIGRYLLDWLRERCIAQGVARLFLEVSTDNAAARCLYLEAGFEVIGRRRNYYADGGDAFVMELPLEQPVTI